VRQSFSHARTKPLVVETKKQRTAAVAGGKAPLLCPSCGARMKLVPTASAPGRPTKLTASCPACGGVAREDNA
jgi:hypothetical protein